MTDDDLTSSASTPYLDSVAATDIARSYKRDLLIALAVETGHDVLDVGCGPDTDLTDLADAVGPSGRVIGVDQDPQMVATARARTAERPTIQVHQADAHRLTLEAHSVDRARIDRVLMHVKDPATVLAELHRVLRPGGMLTLAEPDWDTLAVDHPDLAISRAYTRHVVEHGVRNPAIGRQLPRLAANAGFTLLAVRNAAPLFTDFETAETILGLRRNTERAVAAGYLTAEDAQAWLAHLTADTFFATTSFITVLAQASA